MPTAHQLLRLPEVEALVGLKKSKIYSLIQDGDFPLPVKLGARAVRWKANDIQSWIGNLQPVTNLKEVNA